MKKTLVAVLLLSASASTFAANSNAILGGALGAAAGAAVGHNIGGRNGAILGAAIGGGTGVAVAQSNSPQAQVAPVAARNYRQNKEHEHERRYGEGHDNED